MLVAYTAFFIFILKLVPENSIISPCLKLIPNLMGGLRPTRLRSHNARKINYLISEPDGDETFRFKNGNFGSKHRVSLERLFVAT